MHRIWLFATIFFPKYEKMKEEVIAETEGYFADLEKLHLLQGLKKLENRWAECIEPKGGYKKICFI